NESFQYTAPKQPRKSSNSVCVSLSCRFCPMCSINGQYVKQGKLGAAVLGNHTTKEYKLLLYLSQQKQVAAAKIHVGFVFTVQPNNYCTFYDDQRQNWSLMFESEKASLDFCKEVCLAKANSAASLDTVVVQDLSLGEGQAVESGDSLEVVYTGWLLQNHVIGQMFDSNQNKDKLLRLKVGVGKVIKGWEEGMLGMKKAGHRVIIIPPNLAYGSKGVPNRVPSNSTLIFEVELRRVTPTEYFLHSSLICFVLRLFNRPYLFNSNSLSDQLANPDATKAKLISRMAKMGQPMLPFLTGAASQPESSDSELEVGLHPHPQTVPPSALVPVMTTVAPQPGLPGSSHPYSYTQTSVAPSQLQPVGQVYPAQTVPYMGSSDVTSFLMTEARQHNTEIRLSVGKVADKVEQLASKGSLSVGVSSMSMETSMIMHNIQRIVQENECLKKEVFEKSSRIEEQNHKIGELINQNQRYMEQSNLLLEKRNDSLKSSSEQNHARLLQAEQDKVRLTEDLASATARLSQLQLEASAHQQRAVELQTKLSSALQDSESRSQCIAVLCLCISELKEEVERVQAQYRTEKQKRKEMELRVNNMEEEVQDLKTDKESLERTLSERKKKWQAERQRRDEELEELRKSSQQELDNLRAQLRKARTSTDNAASEQLAQLQAELEEEWKGKCEQMLASTKEHHSRELAELTEQRDALQNKLTQLQEKYTALEQQGVAVREQLERRVAELEKKLGEQESSGDTAAEVKRVMNGVFHSLRGEFDLSESYSGQAVLEVIVTTIKNVHLNGEREVTEEEKEEEEHDEKSDSHQVSETQIDQDVAAEKEANKVTESKTQSQEEASVSTDLHPVSSTELKPQETAAAETELQHELADSSVLKTSAEEKDTSKSADPDDGPGQSSPPEDGPETVVSERNTAVSTNVVKENLDDGGHVGGMNAAAQKAFGPPENPPPPPSTLQNSSEEATG
uniref:peptidylprolyl isomerase n=1 Tax=Sparus aurata TaxID=8175 RepID=A0A671YVK0_SPAAU